MHVTRRDFLAAAGLAALTSGPRPALGAEIGPGQYPLELDRVRDGILYIPRRYTPGVPAPLVVQFHGAGGSGRGAITTFEMAEEFGFVVLAPDSRDERTWDVALRRFGPDEEFLGAAVRLTLSRCSIDRSRMTVSGHSDGASYALSFGIAAGDVFQHIVALSPGVMTPVAANGKPRIFIAHGVKDAVMPIDATARHFVRRLKALDYDVTYREYDGGHAAPAAIVRESFQWSQT